MVRRRRDWGISEFVVDSWIAKFGVRWDGDGSVSDLDSRSWTQGRAESG